MTLICAPMATLSHEAFRLVIEQFGGCDEYFTEMINAPSLLNRGPFEKYYLLNGPAPQKIVWQLTGTTDSSIAQAAAVVAELGGIGVDINMGCSAPQIYKTGAGISWMLKPIAETERLVQSVKQSLDSVEQKTGKHMRLSVKCRLGRDDFTDETFFGFTDMLVANGVELITLHPRTMKEKYRETPKYEYVEKLAARYAANQVAVVLNGAVCDKATAQYALDKAPHAAGIMIARAAAQKPWIFAQLKEQQNQNHTHTIDCQQLALDFIDNVVRCQPPEFYKTRLQRFFAYYCLNFSFAHYFQIQMLNATSVEDSRARVLDYFNKEKDDRFLTY
jgi:tRNA-dihydrouridine synthase